MPFRFSAISSNACRIWRSTRNWVVIPSVSKNGRYSTMSMPTTTLLIICLMVGRSLHRALYSCRKKLTYHLYQSPLLTPHYPRRFALMLKKKRRYGLTISAVSTAWKKCVAFPSFSVQTWVALALYSLPVAFQTPL